MSILIIIFIALAFGHFIIESMILPVYKRETQYQIINLRTELLNYKLNNSDVPKKAITNLANIMVFTVNEFDNHNLFEFLILKYKMRKTIDKDESLIKELDSLQSNPDINRIIMDYNRCVKHTFVINLGAWYMYILPFVIIYECIKLCRIPFIHFYTLRQEIRAIYILVRENNKANKNSTNELSHIHISNNGLVYDQSKNFTADCV